MCQYTCMKQARYVKMMPVSVTVPIVPFISISLGIAILIWVIWPLLSFQLFYQKVSGYIVSPLSDDFVVAAQAYEEPSSSQTDYTNINNWFPKNPAQKTVTPVNSYFISIPKVRIVNALVKIGVNDLSKNLIHYGGTGLPGKYGTAVIFGHSILPAFYDPKNYLSIFSLLPTLKEGDEIFVRFDGVDYRYEVSNMRVTDPDDVSGLEQRYDNSYITLVTCVPPGTYYKRLWLTAKLKQFGEN